MDKVEKRKFETLIKEFSDFDDYLNKNYEEVSNSKKFKNDTGYLIDKKIIDDLKKKLFYDDLKKYIYNDKKFKLFFKFFIIRYIFL